MPVKCSCHLNAGEPVTSKQLPVTALSYQCLKISSLALDLVPFDMSSVVHLHSTPLHLPDAFRHLLTPTLNTLPFEQSTLGRFVHSRCRACTAGLLPSFIQLRNSCFHFCFSWHTSARNWSRLKIQQLKIYSIAHPCYVSPICRW